MFVQLNDGVVLNVDDDGPDSVGAVTIWKSSAGVLHPLISPKALRAWAQNR